MKKQIEYKFECGCVVALMVGGEIEPSVVTDKVNRIAYCDDHGYAEAEEPKDRVVKVDIDHDLKCGCAISLRARVTAIPDDDDGEVEVANGDISYCEEHIENGGVEIPVPLVLLSEDKHHISCSRDEWCDCRTRLANDAIAELEAA